MRVLHVISSLDPALGGPSKACVDMARAVARRGHEVAVYTTDHGQEGRVPADGSPVLRDGVAIRHYRVEWPKPWKRSRPLKAALARDLPGFDVVHLHSLYLYHDWVTGDLCHAHGVPYLLRPHGTLDPYIWRRSRPLKKAMELLFQDRVLRRAAALHFTDEEEMRLAAPFSHGRPGVVVPLGLEDGEIGEPGPPGAFHERFPETRGKRLVLFLSRLHEKKGLDMLVPAFAAAARTRPGLHLVLAGPDDGMRAKAEAWLAAAGMAERATFAGMIGGPVKRAALAAAEVFVLPSYSENFGIAVLEAMGAGLPVLISDRVNLWREVEEAGAGLVVPCTQAPLAEALARLLDRPEEARAMGARGLETARARFRWSAIGARLEEVYEGLAAGSRRST